VRLDLSVVASRDMGMFCGALRAPAPAVAGTRCARRSTPERALGSAPTPGREGSPGLAWGHRRRRARARVQACVFGLFCACCVACTRQPQNALRGHAPQPPPSDSLLRAIPRLRVVDQTRKRVCLCAVHSWRSKACANAETALAHALERFRDLNRR